MNHGSPLENQKKVLNKITLTSHFLCSVIGIDVDIGKELSYSNGSSSTVYRYIGGIWSFQSLRIQS